MPWDKDENGVFLVDENSDPIWIKENGEKKALSYTEYEKKSKALDEVTRESIQRKEKLRALETKYSRIGDIDDFDSWLEKAKRGIEMLDNAPDRDKAIEEQVRSRVDAATKPLNEKIQQAEKAYSELQQRLQREVVTNAFSRSLFVKDKLADPALASDLFSSRFTLKDGELTALDKNGEPMYGATFDEAIAQFVDETPYKTVLLKGSSATGSGANPNSSTHVKPTQKNPWLKEHFNITEQCKLYTENPEQAKAFMESAGVPAFPGM